VPVACFSDFVAPGVKPGVSAAASAPLADLVSNIEFMLVDFWYLLEGLNRNERQTLMIERGAMRVMLVQIASRLVRQIEAYVKEGEVVEGGHHQVWFAGGFVPAPRFSSSSESLSHAQQEFHLRLLETLRRILSSQFGQNTKSGFVVGQRLCRLL
jgi:hypothetical protein